MLVRLNRGLLLAALLLAPGLAAAGDVVLVAGDPAGAHATLTVGPEAVTIETRRAGVAGSRLVLRIDRSPMALFDRILAEPDCAFDAEGSRCRLTVSDPATHAAIIDAFELGRTAHVEVMNAGVMQMQESTTLVGFRRALHAARS